METKHVREKIITAGIALELKERGFDWKIESFYKYIPSPQEEPIYTLKYHNFALYSNEDWERVAKKSQIVLPNVSAPSYDMTVDWLLNKGYYVKAVFLKKDRWRYEIEDVKSGEITKGKSSSEATSRYLALQRGIEFTLENLLKKKTKKK